MAIATSRSPSEAPALTIVGSPSDGRVSEFQKALARRGWGPAQILEYTALADSPHCRPLEGVVRLESPGRDPEVLEVIYRLGIGRHESEGGSPLRGRPLSEALADRGRITSPRQFFLGLVEAMSRIGVRASDAFMNHPDEVALAFDKPRCQAMLADKGIPVPAHLGPLESYEHLRDLMVTEREPRVFVKLNHGSAASGIVAFETQGDREQAWTTAEIVHVGGETRLYNNRRIRRYRDSKDTRDLMDTLCKHGAYAERWLAKASVDGRCSDLRVIVTGGEPTHFVLRSSRGPFTNLHLQGERRDADLLKRCMSAESWQALIDTSRRVAQTFPRTISLGLDIAVTRDLRRHGVLEVNAFGDYVKNVFARGRTPHDAQLEALCP